MYITSTGVKQISETVEFFPHKAEVPNFSSSEVLDSSALDLIDALTNPQPATPLQVGNKQLRALEDLASIFRESTTANGQIVAPPRVRKLIIQKTV